MKNPRKTLFYFFLAYNAMLFIGSIYIDSKQNDLGFLLNFKAYIPWMKYFTFFGLVLFLIAYVIINRDIRLISGDVKKSKDEHTMLKAKLFDLQEAKKSTTAVEEIPATPRDSSETNPDEGTDDDSTNS